MIVVVRPVGEIGAKPFSTLLLSVIPDAGVVLLIGPGGIGAFPLAAWPWDPLLEVYSAVGQLLWRREPTP